VGNRCGDAQVVHPGGSGVRGGSGVPGGSEPQPPRHEPPVVQRYRPEVLGQIVAACVDGRLDPGELAARSEAAQRATTLSGLSAVIADLPGQGHTTMAGHRHRARRLILGFLFSAGWRPFRALAARVRAAAVLGEVMIDLRRTAVTSFVTEITAVALAGEVRIVIPAGFRVDAGLTATVLGRTVTAFPPGRPGPLTPVIRLRSVAVLGNVLTSQVPPAS
jgi:Domain of unknown function (DUF1707)